MFPVQVPVPVVLDQLRHLLRCAADPPGGLGAAPLVAAEAAEVLGLGVDDAAGVVVGKGLSWVPAVGSGPGPARVSVAEAPRVRGIGGADGRIGIEKLGAGPGRRQTERVLWRRSERG